ERARHLGADVVVCAREEDPVDAVLRATDGEGADLVIEAAGVTATRRQSISITRPGGTVGVLGLADAESSIDFLPIVRNELRLVASYSSTPADFTKAIALLTTGYLEVDSLTASHPMSVGPEVFRRLQGGNDLVKAVLWPGS